MWSSNREVAAGDIVIIWLTRDNLYPLLIDPNGKDLNTKFGNFRHVDLIGVPYGSKLAAKHTGKNASRPSLPAPRGFIHILRPTPELWTLALPHRTQILYLADIAFVCAALAIRPGARVAEAGTGSGSFTHSAARAVGSTGRLWSYEFHEARYLKAREEFRQHGMEDVVRLQHRNVCKDGFTNVDELDAMFLDLPAPWEAIEHAKKALRKDRIARICCFSPCIEQVLRTVTALNAAGFSSITMHEVLLRPLEVFQTPPLPGVAGLTERLKGQERKREEKRVRQVEANRALRERERKRKAAEAEVNADVGEEKAAEEDGDRGEGTSAKRARTGAEPGEDADEDAVFAIREEDVVLEMADEDDEALDADAEGDMDVDEALPVSTSASTPVPSTTTPPTATTTTKPPTVDPTTAPQPSTATAARRLLRALESGSGSRGASANAAAAARINVSKALPEVRGHTSYLTFACLVPRPRSVGVRVSVGAEKVEAVEAKNSGSEVGGGEGPDGRAEEGSEAAKAPVAHEE